MASLDERVAALEDAVARLAGEADAASLPTPGASDAGEFWILDGLAARHPAGAVVFAGHADLPGGPIRWQWGRAVSELVEEAWDVASAPLAALGHPVRLRLLQRILDGVTTTSELADTDELGTSGQLHHHLRTLVAAGWLRSAGRGRYEVPVPRVVPLLTVIAAAGG